MGKLWAFIRGQEPAAVAALVVAALTAAASWGLPVTEAQAKSLGPVVMLVLGLIIRQAVASPAKVVEVAAETAKATAAELGEATVGVTGEVTSAAEAVVATVTKEVAAPVAGAPGAIVGKVLDKVLPSSPR